MAGLITAPLDGSPAAESAPLQADRLAAARADPGQTGGADAPPAP